MHSGWLQLVTFREIEKSERCLSGVWACMSAHTAHTPLIHRSDSHQTLILSSLQPAQKLPGATLVRCVSGRQGRGVRIVVTAHCMITVWAVYERCMSCMSGQIAKFAVLWSRKKLKILRINDFCLKNVFFSWKEKWCQYFVYCIFFGFGGPGHAPASPSLLFPESREHQDLWFSPDSCQCKCLIFLEL